MNQILTSLFEQAIEKKILSRKQAENIIAENSNIDGQLDPIVEEEITKYMQNLVTEQKSNIDRWKEADYFKISPEGKIVAVYFGYNVKPLTQEEKGQGYKVINKTVFWKGEEDPVRQVILGKYSNTLDPNKEESYDLQLMNEAEVTGKYAVGDKMEFASMDDVKAVMGDYADSDDLQALVLYFANGGKVLIEMISEEGKVVPKIDFVHGESELQDQVVIQSALTKFFTNEEMMQNVNEEEETPTQQHMWEKEIHTSEFPEDIKLLLFDVDVNFVNVPVKVTYCSEQNEVAINSMESPLTQYFYNVKGIEGVIYNFIKSFAQEQETVNEEGEGMATPGSVPGRGGYSFGNNPSNASDTSVGSGEASGFLKAVEVRSLKPGQKLKKKDGSVLEYCKEGISEDLESVCYLCKDVDGNYVKMNEEEISELDLVDVNEGKKLNKFQQFVNQKLSLYERKFSKEERNQLAKKGLAMPDGAFPIVTEEDLKNAIRLAGRAKDPAEARKFIMKRAKQMKKQERIPKTWGQDGKLQEAKKVNESKATQEDTMSWLTHFLGSVDNDSISIKDIKDNAGDEYDSAMIDKAIKDYADKGKIKVVGQEVEFIQENKKSLNENLYTPILNKYAPTADFDNSAKETRKAYKDVDAKVVWNDLVAINKQRDELAKAIKKETDTAKANKLNAADTVINTISSVLILDLIKKDKATYKNRDGVLDALKKAGIMYLTHSSPELEKMGFWESLNEGADSDMKKLDNFLAGFPDDAKSWSQATDELSDLYKIALNDYNELTTGTKLKDENVSRSASPSEYNKKFKKLIKEVVGKMDDEMKEAFFLHFTDLFESKMNEGYSSQAVADYAKENGAELVGYKVKMSNGDKHRIIEVDTDKDGLILRFPNGSMTVKENDLEKILNGQQFENATLIKESLNEGADQIFKNMANDSQYASKVESAIEKEFKDELVKKYGSSDFADIFDKVGEANYDKTIKDYINKLSRESIKDLDNAINEEVELNINLKDFQNFDFESDTEFLVRIKDSICKLSKGRGGNWREIFVYGEEPYGFGGKSYQSYLEKNEILSWLSKDYRGNVEEISDISELKEAIDDIKSSLDEAQSKFTPEQTKIILNNIPEGNISKVTEVKYVKPYKDAFFIYTAKTSDGNEYEFGVSEDEHKILGASSESLNEGKDEADFSVPKAQLNRLGDNKLEKFLPKGFFIPKEDFSLEQRTGSRNWKLTFKKDSLIYSDGNGLVLVMDKDGGEPKKKVIGNDPVDLSISNSDESQKGHYNRFVSKVDSISGSDAKKMIKTDESLNEGSDKKEQILTFISHSKDGVTADAVEGQFHFIPTPELVKIMAELEKEGKVSVKKDMIVASESKINEGSGDKEFISTDKSRKIAIHKTPAGQYEYAVMEYDDVDGAYEKPRFQAIDWEWLAEEEEAMGDDFKKWFASVKPNEWKVNEGSDSISQKEIIDFLKTNVEGFDAKKIAEKIGADLDKVVSVLSSMKSKGYVQNQDGYWVSTDKGEKEINEKDAKNPYKEKMTAIITDAFKKGDKIPFPDSNGADQYFYKIDGYGVHASKRPDGNDGIANSYGFGDFAKRAGLITESKVDEAATGAADWWNSLTEVERIDACEKNDIEIYHTDMKFEDLSGDEQGLVGDLHAKATSKKNESVGSKLTAKILTDLVSLDGKIIEVKAGEEFVVTDNNEDALEITDDNEEEWQEAPNHYITFKNTKTNVEFFFPLSQAKEFKEIFGTDIKIGLNEGKLGVAVNGKYTVDWDGKSNIIVTDIVNNGELDGKIYPKLVHFRRSYKDGEEQNNAMPYDEFEKMINEGKKVTNEAIDTLRFKEGDILTFPANYKDKDMAGRNLKIQSINKQSGYARLVDPKDKDYWMLRSLETLSKNESLEDEGKPTPMTTSESKALRRLQKEQGK